MPGAQCRVEVPRGRELAVGLVEVAGRERDEAEDLAVEHRDDDVSTLGRELEPAGREPARLVHASLERLDER
jgi:hypothetical protein